MLKKNKFLMLVGLFLAPLMVMLNPPEAKASNAEALEFYKLALEDGNCEMFFVVMEDYPNTTAAKLAKIKYKSCLQDGGNSNSNANNNTNNNRSINNNNQ